MSRLSRYVDYERHAGLYQEGRSLPADVLDRWGAAVRRHLPGRLVSPVRPLRVLDVGAGTGIFARVWPQWAPATVPVPVAIAALEPAEAMIREGRQAAPDVPYAQGVAEDLPFGDETFDAVWASTALHHFSDVERSVAEISRVLRAAGRVLIRTFLPDRTEITWLEAFPALVRRKAVARFPDIEQLTTWFGPHGLAVDAVEEVLEEIGTVTFAEAAGWVEQMRHADSMLTALTDEEVAAGVEALRSEPTIPVRNELSLVVLSRR